MFFFRPIAPENDRKEIESWLGQDDAHAHIPPDFFMEGNEKATCFAVGDEEGTVMYVRQEVEGKDIRLHTQFSPRKRKFVEVMYEAYPILALDLKKRGFKSVVFDSMSPALTRFMVDKFGFEAEVRATL